ncbi:MAG: xylulose kinase, partial [Schaalia hyovaginalis]|nr:xylulose kinase [Schaalia hyovaginalis]
VLIVGGGAKSTAVQALAAQFLDAAVELPEAGEYVALGAAKQAAKVLAEAQ